MRDRGHRLSECLPLIRFSEEALHDRRSLEEMGLLIGGEHLLLGCVQTGYVLVVHPQTCFAFLVGFRDLLSPFAPSPAYRASCHENRVNISTKPPNVVTTPAFKLLGPAQVTDCPISLEARQNCYLVNQKSNNLSKPAYEVRDP